MSETEKPKAGQPASRDRSYYVPHLKEYRSVTELTQEDRESIAASLYGPSEEREREELVRQLEKLADDRDGASGLIEDGDRVSAPEDDDELDD